MVHHDIWDYDNATAPKLLTVRHNGQMVDVVAQAGKTGFLYVFNRVTGEPLWPIEERPVPKSDMPGEQAWPTQPFPTAPPPFARQSFTEKDLSPYIDDPAEKARFLEDIRGARNEGLFTPPGSAEHDADAGQQRRIQLRQRSRRSRNTEPLFVVSKDWPALLKLSAAGRSDGAARSDGSIRYESPFGFMITSSGLPAIAPPWTSLTAYDLNAGTIKWKIPLGEVPELAAKGITDTGSHFPKVGPVVTAGGLIFTGTRDKKIRALRRGHRQAAVDLRSRGRRRRHSRRCTKSTGSSTSCTARLHRRPVTRIHRCIRPRVERATSQHLPAVAVAVAVAAEATSQVRMWRSRYRTGDR